MLILDGREVSKSVRQRLKTEIQEFKSSYGRTPGLAVVIVGDDVASHVYVRNKVQACHNVGLESFRFDLPSSTSEKELLELVRKLNQDPKVDGILVQLPLPQHIDEDKVTETLDPAKDADGFCYENLGLLLAGKKRIVPCTPQGVMTILRHYKIDVAGMNAVVVGRSNIVGKPMATLLTEANATVTLCHSKTKNLSEFTQKADLVVVAAGKKQFLGKSDFKKGAVVVDVGMHGTGEGQLCGDVRFDELKDWVHAATPVPGGVGPMTITTLLENTLKLAVLRQK